LEAEFRRREGNLARKIPAIQKLTGGNPRLILFLYQIVTRSAFLEVESALRELIEWLSDYFRNRYDTLADQPRKVLDTLAQLEGPSTPTEIARSARLSVQKINAQLKRLKGWGYVEPVKHERRRATHYDVTERLFRIWRQTATVAGRQRFRFLAQFLRIYYTPEEMVGIVHSYRSELLVTETLLPKESYTHAVEDLYYFQEAASGPLSREIFELRMDVFIHLGDYMRAEKEAEYFLSSSVRIEDRAGMAIAYRKQAEVHAATGRYEDASKDIEQLLRMAHYQEALASAESVLGRIPTLAKAWASKGAAALILGDFTKGLESFQRATDLQPGEARYWGMRALGLIGLDRHSDALVCAERAIELQVEDPRGWTTRGIAANNLGDHAKALESFQKASALQPEEAAYWRLQGQALSNLDRHSDALVCAERAIELQVEDPRGWTTRGIAANNLGDHAKALESFQKASALQPEEAAHWRLQAQALRKLGRQEERLRCAQRAVELEPKMAQAWLELAGAAEQLGDYELALTCTRKVTELVPERALSWQAQGVALRNLGRQEEALTCVGRAINLQPDNANLLLEKADLLSQLRRIEESLALLDEALNRDASERDVFHARGDILLLSGRFEEAREALERGLVVAPDDWDLLVDREINCACLGEHGPNMEGLAAAVLAVKIPISAPAFIVRFLFDIVERCTTRGDLARARHLLDVAFSMPWQHEEWFGKSLGVFIGKLLDGPPLAFEMAIERVNERIAESNILALLKPYLQAAELVRTGDVSILDRLFPEIRELVLEISQRLRRRAPSNRSQ
jgi:tetratricopeptide (TPR) repeat protein